jgi:hypothetical protein
MAWLSLVAFGGLPLAAAATAVAAFWPASRAERALAAVVVALALVLVPIHVLAWLGLVSRVSVLGTISFLSCATLALAGRGATPPSPLGALLELLRLPWDALRLAWRERHVAGLGLLAYAGIVVWALTVSYFAPANTWDGLCTTSRSWRTRSS